MNKGIRSAKRSLLSGGLMTLAMTTPLASSMALAQAEIAASGEQVAARGRGANTLEEVIVTAEKRAVDIQNIPLTVTAVSAESLDRSNIVDLAGLNGYVPGLSIQKSSGSERIVSIRGVGSETPQNVYSQPGVSVHIDGIYAPNSLGLAAGLFDVDRVEVLRGPQGTLFGQSSTGGVINIVSKQPKLDGFSGDAEFSVGNYGLHRERLSVNVPLGDTVAVRLAGQRYAHEGFGKSVFLNNYELDDANDENIKASVLWRPNEDFSATLTALRYREDHNGALQKNVNDPTPGARNVSQDFPAYLKLENKTIGLVLDYDLGWATLRSVTGYQDMDHDQGIDDDRLSWPIFGRYDAQAYWPTTSKSTTQEINLLSNPGGRLDWIVGAYYMDQETAQEIFEFRGAGAPPPSFPIPGRDEAIPANLGYQETSAVDRTSWAAFFQSTLHITDTLRLTAGARYNYDEYSGRASFKFDPYTSVDYDSDEITGKVQLETDFTPNSLLYAGWTRGYKPGGVNNGWDNARIVQPTYAAETADSFEIGSKNRLFGDTVTVNVSAFYYKYENMQYLSNDPVMWQNGTGNIPRTDIWGAELESDILLLERRLRIGLTLTALDGELKDDFYLIDAKTAADARAAAALLGYSAYTTEAEDMVQAAAKNSKGNKPPKLPKLTGAINAAYTFSFGAHTLVPRLEYVYRGDYQYRVFNDGAMDTVSSYGIWNFHLEYLPPNEALRFSLAATNLADKEALSGRFTDPYGAGQTSEELIAPRQLVFTVGYKF